MNFDFQAIKRLCCRKETQTNEEKMQEQHSHAYQTHRPSHNTAHNIHNSHNNRISLAHSPPKLGDYKETIDSRYFMKSRDYKLPVRERTNQVRFSLQKGGFDTRNFHPNKSPDIQKPCLSPHVRNLVQPTTKIFFIKSQRNSNRQSDKARSPRVTFTHASSKQEPRTQGKRLKTQEEETQYSSKHSQIAFRNHNIAPDPLQAASLVTFKKHNSIYFQKRVIFQQQKEQLQHNQSLNCKQVSARFQMDHSFNNDLLFNARTIQSIMTSNQINSKFTSRMPSNVQDKKQQLLLFTPSSSKQYIKQGVSFNQTERQNSPTLVRNYHCALRSGQRSVSPPPSPIVSPKVQENSLSPNAQSNLFYGSSVARKHRKSPKVSVLELNESQQNDQYSQAQELRDVIDNNYLQSQYCSHSNSPILSINQSMKNLSDEKQRKAVSFFKSSPEHSREASNQLQLFKQTRAKLKRTNTIQSFQSYSSENSCIDIKFMQRMRGRREVSHLV